jgi:hypothetical protein
MYVGLVVDVLTVNTVGKESSLCAGEGCRYHFHRTHQERVLVVVLALREPPGRVCIASAVCIKAVDVLRVYPAVTTNIIFIHINLIVCACISLTNGILPQDISFQEHLRFH